MSREHLLLCNGATLARAASAWKNAASHQLQTGENVRIEIASLAAKLGANVSPRFADLTEIAALVYAADQAIPRSGTVTFDYGDRWIRKLRFEIAVRCPDFWNQPDVLECLKETLDFLTGDSYEFRFSRNPTPSPFERFLGFGDINPEGIDKIILYSGGIDSLTGAVEEILHHQRKVVLLSHSPVSHLMTRQQRLAQQITARVSERGLAPIHLTVVANKVGEFDHDYTQRSRSFLFSSIAAVAGHIFGVDGVDFYENGIVSLNLPLCDQELNGRASRTTHPQAVFRFSQLLSKISGHTVNVENHYLPLTKQDVVERLKSLGHVDLLSDSISCSHTRGYTQSSPQCGLCSQCLSRRFATLGADAEAHDQESLYRSNVLLGERSRTEERTLAERFVGVARSIEKMADMHEFQRLFANELARATPYLCGNNRDATAQQFELHRRHAQQVGAVIEQAMKRHIGEYRNGTLRNTSTLWFAFCLAQSGVAAPASPNGNQPDREVISKQVDRLNQMERDIIESLAEHDITDPELDELPGQKKLAEWAGYEFNTNVKNALTALVKSGLLGNLKHRGRRGGYFLTAAGVVAGEIVRNATGHD